jgi:hypothetical protein
VIGGYGGEMVMINNTVHDGHDFKKCNKTKSPNVNRLEQEYGFIQTLIYTSLWLFLKRCYPTCPIFMKNVKHFHVSSLCRPVNKGVSLGIFKGSELKFSVIRKCSKIYRGASPNMFTYSEDSFNIIKTCALKPYRTALNRADVIFDI